MENSTSIKEEPHLLNDTAKSLKEEFVSNTTGTIPIEIFLMAMVTLSSFALHAVFRIFIKQLKIDATVNKFLFIIENVFIVFPILLAFTLLADELLMVNVSLIAVTMYILYQLCFCDYPEFLSRFWDCKVDDIKQNYLTNYKANIQITTAICILAVDFNIFPRRFAKAEVYGIGIMDMAVGTIIFSNALASRQARYSIGVNTDCLLANLQTSSLLVGLGVVRTLLLKGINYQEHVVEYGVHWNFFLTIAVIKPLANFILSLSNCAAKQPLYLCLSLVIITAYQVALSIYGLAGIIQTGFYGDNSRGNFIDANREGIFSCIGYLSIYFSGLFFGRQLFKKNHSLHNKLFWLVSWFIAAYVSMTISIHFFTPISRQMANISYYFIQIAFNTFLLFGFILIDMICFASQVTRFRRGRKTEGNVVSASILSRAISGNLLIYFLLANVLTGLVNLMFDTLECNAMKSMSIIIFYIVVLNNLIWTEFAFKNRIPPKKFTSIE